MKRIVIFTCQSMPQRQDAQLLRAMLSHGGETAPDLVETGDTDQTLGELKERLSQYDLFVVAAEHTQFHGLKSRLLSCLGFACAERPEITRLQAEQNVASQEDALYPPDARVFLTKSGFCNGFALHRGLQDLLMLPLEPGLLEQLAPQLAAYLEHPKLQVAAEPAEDPPLSELDIQFMRLGERSAASIKAIEPAEIEPEPLRSPEPVYAAILPFRPAARNKNEGRGRAVAAASLALCSLVASLFIALYYNNRGGQPETTRHTVPPAASGDAIELGADSLEAIIGTLEAMAAQAAALDARELAINDAQQDAAVAGAALSMRDSLLAQLQRFIAIIQMIYENLLTSPATPPATAPPATPPPATTQPPATATPAAKGTFRFEVQGFGHGVGMSQEGARTFARQGWSYEQIIKHYYYDSGISIAKETAKSTIKHGGKSYPVKEYLARIAYCEIGGPSQTADEAIKAQMICAYTIAKRNGYSTTETNQHILPDSKWNANPAKQYRDKMYSLAESVLGRYVSYNGGTADALVFASCAGVTASGKYAWSGNEPAPYLRGGRSSPETVDRSSLTYTHSDIQAMVKTYNSKYPGNAITLGSDPSQWFKILSKDANGYVEQLQIGNRVFTGGNARLYFFGSMVLRSHNFTVKYE